MENKGLESFYKMRDTLIAEGYNYPECLETMCEIEKSLSALEIIKEYMFVKEDENGLYWLMLLGYGVGITKEQFNVLKEVLL